MIYCELKGNYCILPIKRNKAAKSWKFNYVNYYKYEISKYNYCILLVLKCKKVFFSDFVFVGKKTNLPILNAVYIKTSYQFTLWNVDVEGKKIKK